MTRCWVCGRPLSAGPKHLDGSQTVAISPEGMRWETSGVEEPLTFEVLERYAQQIKDQPNHRPGLYDARWFALGILVPL